MIYQIYNYKVNSNIVLEHLIYSKNQSAFDINLKFNVGDIDRNRYCECMISQDYYILNLYNIIYKINKLGNQIEVYCRDLEFFYSSCYNIPFSIISYINKNILLHSSAIEKHNKIIAFCGKKGQGKTTLVSYLSKYYNFYTDDTMILKLNNGLCLCERSNSPLKMNEDILTMHDGEHELYTISRKNVLQKAYINPRDIKVNISEKNKSVLDKIIILNRNKNENSEIRIRKIDDYVSINSLILTNIVGSKYFPYEIISDYTNFKIYSYIINKIDFYILDYPTSLESLENVKHVLEGII